MADATYESDVVVWADRQADLLRRLAHGERVNEEIDWENVIEEVQDVGSSAVRAVESLLTRALEHLLKVHGWPEGPVRQWRNEVRVFLSDAASAYTPAMRQRLDVERLYRRARAVVDGTVLLDRAPDPLPEYCPFALDDLLVQDAVPDITALLRRLEVGREF